MTAKTTPADRERAMFGCTIEDLTTFVEKYVSKPDDIRLFADRKAAALSLLSDAQEEMAMGLVERARKTINRAKWLLNEAVGS